jgi:hypothetical protein
MFRTTGCGVTATCTMLVRHCGHTASVSIAIEDMRFPFSSSEAFGAAILGSTYLDKLV